MRAPLTTTAASLLLLAGCSSTAFDLPDAGPDLDSGIDLGVPDSGALPGDGGWTYYHDIQPIVQTKCAGCHYPGGIAPFALQSYVDVITHLDAGYDGGPGIISAVMEGLMPPWPPSSTCATYQYNRSLTADETTEILAWGMSGAPAGNKADQVTGIPPGGGLSRTDVTISMPAAYTPQLSPDDYRCFLLDWPVQNTTHITGVLVRPGTPAMVHHSIVFLVPPGDVAVYEAIDAGPGQVGYSCFGGPSGDSSAPFGGVVGAWVPGNSAADYPADAGITIQPGSKIVVQMHYNTYNGVFPDLSSVDFKTDTNVQTEAAVFIYTNPEWELDPSSMLIPAGQSDVEYKFSFDVSQYLNTITSGALPNGSFHIYTALNHMHLRGTRETLQVAHTDGTSTCLLDTESWNFRWQGSYYLNEPVLFQPGDRLAIDCHWDNSAANQPIENGVQVAPMDLQWGEDTNNEMCLGAFFVTQ